MQITAHGKTLPYPSLKTLLIMKFTAFFLLIASLQVYAKGIAQISIKEKKAPLEKVLLQIKKQSGYDLVYNVQLVKEKGKPVDVTVTNVPVQQALSEIFKNQVLTYEITSKNMILVKEKEAPKPTIQTTAITPNATIDVRGVVKDEAGKPAAGVTVSVKGTNKITSTNEQGEFTLKNVEDNAVLVFSSVNLQTFEVKVKAGSSNDIAVTLKAKVSQLGDVAVVAVNTGYQTISRDRVNGSYFVVDSASFNRRISGDAISRLEGIVPGLLFNRNVNSPGTNNSGLNLSIRGHSTILANDQPLVVVDNFPYDGDINNINPNDIENVTILKDASASSIWGARSGNGVIVITTKKGKRNQPVAMEFNGNVTIGNKPDLYYLKNFIASTDFIDVEKTLFGLGYFDADLTSTARPVVSPVVKILALQRAGKITAADATQQIDQLRNNDIRQDVSSFLLQKSIREQYSFNMKGGGASSDYFLSFGFDNTRANAIANSNKRVTITSIANFYPAKGLTLSAGVYYVQSNILGNSVDIDNISPKLGIYPYAKLVDNNGNTTNIDKTYSSLYTDTLGAGKLASWRYSPLEEVATNYRKNNQIDNRINISSKYSFPNGFSIEGKFQYQKNSTSTNNYSGDSSYAARLLYNRYTNLTTGAHPIPGGSIMQLANGTQVSYRSRLQLNYNHTWKVHAISVLAGAEINSTTTQTSSNTLYGYKEDLGTFSFVDLVTIFPTLPTGTARIPFTSSYAQTNDRFLSYFSNGSYLFKSRYSITASARIDKSNLFGVNTNQKSVPLYSVGTGWEFAREKFVKVPWLDAGKIRATYGYNGNVNRNVAAVTTFVNLSPSMFNRIEFASISNSGNPELRWEKISMFNLGLDFSILKNRISGSFEYYMKKGNDLFGQKPMILSTGLSTLTGNFADTRGSGIDITLHSVNIRSNNIQWTTDFVFSTAKDIVTKYDVKAAVSTYLINGDNNSSGSGYIPLEGKPLFAVYSYRFAGLDALGDPMGYLNGKPSKDWPAIIASTTTDSMLYSGSSRPTIFGSLRNSVSYKGFTLSVNVIYKLGYYFRRSAFSPTSLYKSWVAHQDFYNRWQKPGDENFTDVPAMQHPPENSNRTTFYDRSSALVERGDHIRLQDINLSYQFTSKSIKRVGFSALQVYSYLNNVGLIWRANKRNIDPDISTYGNSMPIPFSIAFGVKANF